jgi:hypothetical protein
MNPFKVVLTYNHTQDLTDLLVISSVTSEVKVD